jgi:hypothetical protein
MRKLIIGLVLILLAGAALPAREHPDGSPALKAGVWELRTRGVIRENGKESPTMVRRQKIDASRLLPRPERYGKSCRQTKLYREPGLLEWRIECDKDPFYSVEARFRFGREHYEGNITTRRRSLYNRVLTIDNRVTGRYIGPATESSARRAP